MENLYVLGHPVSHSKSPAMHNALYAKLGLDWQYDLADYNEESQAASFLKDARFLGINITMPYKPHAFKRADVADPSAVLAQGANVLVWETDNGQSALKAYNMDGYGCVRYLESEGVAFAGEDVVVCGTGPTSLAIMHAAIMKGVRRMTLLGRSLERTQRVVEDWLGRVSKTEDAQFAMEVELCGKDYESGAGDVASASLLIDATPLGMCKGDPAVVDEALLCSEATVFDVVYGHGETALARSAHERGCKFLNGEGMLVGQAVLGAQKFLDAAHVELPGGKLDFGKAFNVMAEGADFDVRIGL